MVDGLDSGQHNQLSPVGRTHDRITLDIAKFTSRVAITPTTKH
jgi:hypothetical protein